MKALIPPDTAAGLISEHLPSVPAIPCPLTKCAGRILREAIVADRPFPPFNRSMMDGYALRAADGATTESFRVVAQAAAGAAPVRIGPGAGDCVEIMTGAVVPEDADCVVPYEATTPVGEGRIRLSEPQAVAPGDCIHPAGNDAGAGARLIEPGGLIGSRQIAAAATCGYNALKVSKMPAIAIVGTGDELVDVDQKPEAFQIRKSNDLCIETALARAQLHAGERVHLSDDAASSRAVLEELIGRNRFIILSGGISMGKKDFIPEALEALGLTCRFHGVAQKPGKPFGFWTRATCAVFALPGNPLSTLTCLHHYVIPALHRAMGQIAFEKPHRIPLAEAARARDDLTLFLPVILTDAGARPCPAGNSGDLVGILESDGYIELPPTPLKRYGAADGSFAFCRWL